MFTDSLVIGRDVSARDTLPSKLLFFYLPTRFVFVPKIPDEVVSSDCLKVSYCHVSMAPVLQLPCVQRYRVPLS